MSLHRGNLNAEVGEIFIEAWQALFVTIGAEDFSLIIHHAGDHRCLATRGCTGIQDTLARLWCHELNTVARCWVLDIDKAVFHPLTRRWPLKLIKAFNALHGSCFLICRHRRCCVLV